MAVGEVEYLAELLGWLCIVNIADVDCSGRLQPWNLYDGWVRAELGVECFSVQVVAES